MHSTTLGAFVARVHKNECGATGATDSEKVTRLCVCSRAAYSEDKGEGENICLMSVVIWANAPRGGPAPIADLMSDLR